MALLGSRTVPVCIVLARLLHRHLERLPEHLLFRVVSLLLFGVKVSGFRVSELRVESGEWRVKSGEWREEN
jgi:uncharacterized membrane protein